MTRDEVNKNIETLSLYLTYPALDHVHALDEADSDQRAEIERLTQERDRLRTALENLKHADGCYCEASFSPIGCHPRHSAECQQAQQALRGAGEEPGA